MPRLQHVRLLILVAVVCLAWSGQSSAAVLDLTTAGSEGFINDTFFTTNQQQTTGTGFIQPFLRIQGAPTEMGYNTNGEPKEFQTKDDGWTQAIRVGQVPEVTIGGVVYREFLVDINESGSDKTIFLSLDYLQIFLGSTATAVGYTGPGGTPTLAGTTLAYNLGAGNHVLTNYSLNPGSGAGDLFIYIPTTYFGSDPNLWMYMFAGFGFLGDYLGNNYNSNDGFEEIAVRSPTPGTPVPEPGTMALLGSGLVGLASWGRKKFRK